MIDQSLGAMAVSGDVDRRTKQHQVRAVWRSSPSMFAAGGGSGALVSGLGYGNLPDGMDFDQQRNMAPTSHGTEREVEHKSEFQRGLDGTRCGSPRAAKGL
jgi:hypothetical protein